jgi:WD40 repeat protein
VVSEQSLEQFGGVLAAPTRRQRRAAVVMIAAATLALALTAACLVVIISPLLEGPAGLIATLDFGDSATSAAFSPDGKTLAVNDTDGSTYLWGIAAGRRTGVLPPGSCRGGAAQVLFSPNGTTLAGGNGTEVWDVATKHLIATVNGPSGSNTEEPGAIVFSPDSTLMAVVDSNTNGRTYLWRVSELRSSG